MEREVNINNTEEPHKVFNNDPKYFKSLINKTVEIITQDGTIHTGQVYVVDPVSESVVTFTNGKDRYKVNIYLGHAIKSMKICDCKKNTNNAIESIVSKQPQHNIEELHEKRIALKLWLNKNLVDVQEDGMTLKLGEDLIFEPPYDIQNLYSCNTIILQRVTEILNKMPSSNT